MTNHDYVPAGDAYAKYYGAIDPRRKFAFDMPAGQAYSCADHFDRAFVDRNEFYQDLLIPWNLRYVIGGTVYREENLNVMFAFNHLVGQPAFSPKQIAAANRMLPHIERALRFITKSEKLRAAMLAGSVGLEALGQAVVVLDRRNLITFSNALADALIKKNVVFQTANQRLETTTRGNSQLSASIERVRTMRQPESLTVRIAGLSAEPEKSFFVTIIPISPEPLIQIVSPHSGAHANWATSSASVHNTFSAADLMIIVSSAGTERTPSSKQLIQWFNFSPAEAKLTQALVTGLSLEEYATESHVSVVTVRNQLRSVLQKSGYRRQQDLVRALAKLPSSDPSS
ncbi:helix-turn-helix transcriptional regulator [Caballeronia sp. M23-90]